MRKRSNAWQNGAKPGTNYFGEPSPTKVTIEVNFRLLEPVREENKK